MMGLLIFIEVVTALLLIGIILLQKTKDEGLGLAFGAGVGESLFGSRAGNVLTKITIGLAVVFLSDTLLIGYMSAGTVRSGSVTDQLPADRSAPAAPMGAAPASIPSGALPAAAPTAGGSTIPAQVPAEAP